MDAEDSGQHGPHAQVIHHQLRAQKHQQNGEVVTVMSTLDCNTKPRGFQVVGMISCESLCYFRGNDVYMLDLMLPEGQKVAKGDQDGGKDETCALAERLNLSKSSRIATEGR